MSGWTKRRFKHPRRQLSMCVLSMHVSIVLNYFSFVNLVLWVCLPLLEITTYHYKEITGEPSVI